MTGEPNEAQRALIEATEGVVLVDAGAGTGKTFTIAHRYLHVIHEHGVRPDDLLLITFTNNAADEMRERILRFARGHPAKVSPAELDEAPISTFHAMANRILSRHGFEAPRYLGLDEPLASGFKVVSNAVHEAELFDEFLRGFRRAHPEHAVILQALHAPRNLLGLVKTLASKGVVPSVDGWYLGSDAVLAGDRDAWLDLFRQANESDGGRQSRALSSFKAAASRKVFDPPSRATELLDRGDGKRLDEGDAAAAFDEDRSALMAFVHDVYFEYLRFVLRRNVLNFPFLLVLALVLLVEDDALRERLAYDFVMIDEFQDASEVQLQLALLLCGRPNLCCVGDWKQSIYGFQHASVDNILDFERRLAEYGARLNAGHARVVFGEDAARSVRRIDLDENYRSAQVILDRAEDALVVRGNETEDVDEAAVRKRTVHLSSRVEHQTARLERWRADDEVDAVLARVTAMVGNDDYAVADEGSLRAPRWSDVAVLTRTRGFALELQARARELGVPVAFEGGHEVYDTDQARVLLAWLRVLDNPHARRGWAVILDEAGYSFDEARAILDRDHPADVPADMRALADRLGRLSSVGAQARAVFDHYGLDDGVTAAIIHHVQSSYDATRAAPADMVRHVEDHRASRTIVDVDDHAGDDVVTVQTIHAAKGLEYPIVVVADINTQHFPSTGGGPGGAITYREPAGLRISKTIAETPLGPYKCDNWAASLLHACIPSRDYDEERRLYYVAMTRAKHHLVLFAGARPSYFWADMEGVEAREFDGGDVVPARSGPATGTAETRGSGDGAGADVLRIDIGSDGHPRRMTVGQLVGEPETSGREGPEFGKRVHDVAARYARNERVELSSKDDRNVASVIDGLDGRLEAEVPCAMRMDVDGEEVLVEGKIDLVHWRGDGAVEVYDWKTTPSGEGLDVYGEQVRCYVRIVEAVVGGGVDVRGFVVFTEDGAVHGVE